MLSQRERTEHHSQANAFPSHDAASCCCNDAKKAWATDLRDAQILLSNASGAKRIISRSIGKIRRIASRLNRCSRAGRLLLRRCEVFLQEAREIAGGEVVLRAEEEFHLVAIRAADVDFALCGEIRDAAE
jgi:hypothetical protein